MTLQYHKDLFIQMLVQAGTLTRCSLHPEKRNGNASMFPSLKQIAVSMAELFSGNDLFHVFSPFTCSKVRDCGNDLTTDDLERRDPVHISLILPSPRQSFRRTSQRPNPRALRSASAT